MKNPALYGAGFLFRGGIRFRVRNGFQAGCFALLLVEFLLELLDPAG